MQLTDADDDHDDDDDDDDDDDEIKEMHTMRQYPYTNQRKAYNAPIPIHKLNKSVRCANTHTQINGI